MIEPLLKNHLIQLFKDNETIKKLVKEFEFNDSDAEEFSKDYVGFIIHELREYCERGNCPHLAKMVKWIRKSNKVIQDFLPLNNEIKKQLKDKGSLEEWAEFTTIIDVRTTYLFTYYLNMMDQYRKVFLSSGLFSRTNKQGIIEEVNDQFCEISGYSREELIGQSHNIIRHPEFPRETFKNLWATILSKKHWVGDVKNKKKSGDSYWVRSFVTPICDLNGEIIEFVSVRVDITELQESLKSSEEYKNALNETSMVLYLDLDGKIKESNDLFRDSFEDKELGFDKKMKDKSFFNLEESKSGEICMFKSESKDLLNDGNLIEDLLHPLKNEKISKKLLKFRNNKNEIIWCYTTILKIENASGELKGYVVILNDVTDIENAKVQAELNLKNVEELNKQKDDFINVASHELRTPITLINGYTELILDTYFDLDKDLVKDLEVIQKGSKYLTELVKDMLDITKLDSDKVILSYTDLNLKEFIHKISNSLKSQVKEKSLNLDIEYNLKDDFILKTDELILNKVLYNLLTNAIKFTDMGAVTISINELDSSKIGISVKDTGIGIDEENYELVFKKFGQVKTGLTRELEGTGLGLPIVRGLVGKLGGTITLRSEKGKGSEFTVELPLIK